MGEGIQSPMQYPYPSDSSVRTVTEVSVVVPACLLQLLLVLTLHLLQAPPYVRDSFHQLPGSRPIWQEVPVGRVACKSST